MSEKQKGTRAKKNRLGLDKKYPSDQDKESITTPSPTQPIEDPHRPQQPTKKERKETRMAGGHAPTIRPQRRISPSGPKCCSGSELSLRGTTCTNVALPKLVNGRECQKRETCQRSDSPTFIESPDQRPLTNKPTS